MISRACGNPVCCENKALKGADQLRGYRKADLRLCFHIHNTQHDAAQIMKGAKQCAVSTDLLRIVFASLDVIKPDLFLLRYLVS